MKKIKIKKRPNEKQREFKFHRLVLPNMIRFIVLAVIGLMVLYSLVNYGIVSGEPETETVNKFNYSYSQEGKFDNNIYLLENTIYDNATKLPSGGTAFRSIIDYVDSYFNYSYSSNEQSQVHLSYTLEAVLQTSLWTKTYALSSENIIEKIDTRISFSLPFDLNYETYEEIIKQINEETETSAKDPQLTIQCKIEGYAKIKDDKKTLDYTPMMTLLLNGNTLEITTSMGNSFTYQDTVRETKTLQNVIDDKAKWTNFAILFLILLVLTFILTVADTPDMDDIDRMVDKIKKKYGEWIVEVDKIPKRAVGSELISMKSIDDLIKTSEELGKPMIHYQNKDTHIFYVLDDTNHYEYTFAENGKINKSVRCPQCSTKIEINGFPGETVDLECPNCHKKGSTEI